MLVLGLTAVFILFMFRSGPSPSHIAWLVYLIGIGVILINPRYGIYLNPFLGTNG
ncbi:MAG: hypothetical protein M5U34_39480 [Chloroflexi bacterium]|nr:hypothetical protein [Chloroflexota bacterium]